MNLFSRAPTIGRHHVHGVWAEGDHEASLPFLDTFRHGVSSFGFLLSPGERLTGAQWMQRIRSTYCEEEPRTRMVLDAIHEVMKVRQFGDDYVLCSPERRPAFRGRLAHCQVHARALASLDPRWADAPIDPASNVDINVCNEADAAMLNLRLDGAKLVAGNTARLFDDEPEGSALYDEHMFAGNVASHYKLMVTNGKKAGLWHAMIRQLRQSATNGARASGGVGSDHPASDPDLDAQLHLTTELARFAGYSAAVTYAVGFKPRPGDSKFPGDADVTVDQVRDSLGIFVRSLIEQGWKHDDDAPVLLVRPAPLVNPQASVQPHERVIHPQLIGWQVPADLINHLVEQASEKRYERERG